MKQNIPHRLNLCGNKSFPINYGDRTKMATLFSIYYDILVEM